MNLTRDLMGKVLREERIRQSRSLRDVSSEASVSLSYLSDVENGNKDPSAEMVEAIAIALRLPLYLVYSRLANELKAKTITPIKITFDLPKATGPTINDKMWMVAKRQNPELTNA